VFSFTKFSRATRVAQLDFCSVGGRICVIIYRITIHKGAKKLLEHDFAVGNDPDGFDLGVRHAIKIVRRDHPGASLLEGDVSITIKNPSNSQ
jgi:hypothetical protein